MDDTTTLLQQIGDLVGFGTYDSIVYDIFGFFVLLFCMMVFFNLVYVIISVFFRR